MAWAHLTRYRPSDREEFADLVMAVHVEFGFEFDADLDADLGDPESHYRHIRLVKAGHTVVGSAALTAPRGGVVTLKRMYLRPPLRGEGWGLRLLTTMIELATRDGSRRIELDTTVRQRAARRLYEKAGFKAFRRAGGTLHYARDLPTLPEAENLSPHPSN